MQAGRGRGFGDRRVRAGALVRAAPSSYVPHDADLGARIAAALQHAGPGAVLTGWVGCLALRLPDVPQRAAVPVLVPACRRRVSTPHVRVMPTTRRRVVCALAVTMESFWPSSALSSVLLPALGRPMMAT